MPFPIRGHPAEPLSELVPTPRRIPAIFQKRSGLTALSWWGPATSVVLVTTRPVLSEPGFETRKRSRLPRNVFQRGLSNGAALLLPYDQGLEHGPRDFFSSPPASDPRVIIRLAKEGGFNGIVVQFGSAEKFYWRYAGEVPLVLKLNGKTDVSSDGEALSPLNATVEVAVRMGADAVGYTLYFGSPAQSQDFEQNRKVRAVAVRFGTPLICGLHRAARRSPPKAARIPSTPSITPPESPVASAPTSSKSTSHARSRSPR
jgi:hypothetical protein